MLLLILLLKVLQLFFSTSATLFGFRLTVFILGLVVFGFHLSAFYPHYYGESIGPIVNQDIVQATPGEIIYQTPYLRELIRMYYHVASLHQHQEVAINAVIDSGSFLTYRLEDRLSLSSYEGFRQLHPLLVYNINGVAEFVNDFHERRDEGADIHLKAHILKCLLYEIQNIIKFIGPAGVSYTFPDMFPSGQVGLVFNLAQK